MSRTLNLLFPSKNYSGGDSTFLLVMRLIFGLLLMSHGLMKFDNFAILADTFPDPLGIGSRMSLILAIFGEVVCPIGFIIGAFYRLAMIPMIFTMCIAVFNIHAHDPFAVKELAVVYLIIYVMMFLAGAGRYSLDYLIGCRLKQQATAM